jgi:hypothetical protein
MSSRWSNPKLDLLFTTGKLAFTVATTSAMCPHGTEHCRDSLCRVPCNVDTRQRSRPRWREKQTHGRLLSTAEGPQSTQQTIGHDRDWGHDRDRTTLESLLFQFPPRFCAISLLSRHYFVVCLNMVKLFILLFPLYFVYNVPKKIPE